MKGKRTIFFNVAMLVLGLLGIHLAPAALQQYGDWLVCLWGVGGILLRQVTTTPIFTKELQAIEAKAATLGLDPSVVQDLANQLASLLPTGSIFPAFATLSGKVESLLAAVGNTPTGAPVADAAPAVAPIAAAPAPLVVPATPVAQPAPAVAVPGAVA